MTSPWRPVPQGQIDGSRYQYYNCVLAVSTAIVNRSTGGRLRPPPAALRTLSGITAYRGLYPSEAADAVVRATSGQVILETRILDNRSQLRDLVASGRPLGLMIHCSVTRYALNGEFRTNYFTGLHEWFINDYRFIPPESGGSPRGEFLYDDPGTTQAGFRWVPADLAYRAAEAAYGGQIVVRLGKDTEGVQRTVRKHPQAFLRRGPGLQYGPVQKLRGGTPVKVVETLNATGQHGTWSYYGKKDDAWALLDWEGKQRYVAACFLD